MKLYEVCVIGGGPAGLSASIILGSTLKNVALLTQPRNYESFPNKGETLGISVVEYLDVLDIKREFDNLNFHKVSGFESCWGSNEPFYRPSIISPVGEGWIIDRSAFEQMMITKNQNLGVEIISCDVISVKQFDGFFEIQINDDFVGRIVRARYIIYATGRKSKKFPCTCSKVSIDKLVSCVVTLPTNSEKIDFNVRVEAVNDGWFYTVQPSHAYRILSFFTDGDLIGQSRKSEMLSKLINKIQATKTLSKIVTIEMLESVEKVDVFSANTTYSVNWYGLGWLACGDIVQTIDPLSSMGITVAISDGINVAKALIKIITQNAFSFELHDTLRKNIFLKYLRLRFSYYNQERRWPNSIFWKRRQGNNQFAKIAKALNT